MELERLRSLLDEIGAGRAGSSCTHPECREAFYHELRTKGDAIVEIFPLFAQAHARKSIDELISEESDPDRKVPCQHVPQPSRIDPGDVRKALEEARRRNAEAAVTPETEKRQ